MLWVGFERKIPASERAKAFHALDCEATVNGWLIPLKDKIEGRQDICTRLVTNNLQFRCDLSRAYTKQYAD
jgi:hypothetical protein